MSKSPNALARLRNDDFLFSSDISHHSGWRRMLLALAPALILAGCQAETAPAPEARRPVQVQRVAFGAEAASRDFVGVVRARYETDLGFRVGGKIVSRRVNVGDAVRAGDVIARLDPEDLKLQVQSAEAELDAATSSRVQTSADLDRYTTLKERGYAAVAQFEIKKAAFDEAEGRLVRARRALDLARNQLEYAELKANADGVITATLAEAGQVVTLGQPVARLAHRGEKEAVVALPENWLSHARQSWATVRLWSDNGRAFTAQLRELSPQADPATRTYLARFTILEADDAVAYGMTATVRLERTAAGQTARLPLASVVNRGEGPSVYVVGAGDTLALKPVIVSAFDADVALVTAGVKDGDRVVSLGVQKLESGQKVRPVEAP